MDLTEELVYLFVEKCCDGKQVQFCDMTINFAKPWRRAKYAELLEEYSGCKIDDISALRKKAAELEIDQAKMDDVVVISEVFEACVEDKLIDPTFVMDYPAQLCPLTRRSKENPDYAERFELYIGKMEVANAYTELNDPAVQEKNFRIQLRGQEDTMAKMDEDFLTALKYAMPPAGGLGIGIDRLIMFLTGAASIRDVVLFPLLRPKK
jgi:lysyl-tRNA synthetase class 2